MNLIGLLLVNLLSSGGFGAELSCLPQVSECRAQYVWENLPEPLSVSKETRTNPKGPFQLIENYLKEARDLKTEIIAAEKAMATADQGYIWPPTTLEDIRRRLSGEKPRDEDKFQKSHSRLPAVTQRAVRVV